MEYRVHVYDNHTRSAAYPPVAADISQIDHTGKGTTAILTERASDRLGEILAAAIDGDQLSDINADSFALNAHLYRLILPTDKNVIARLETASPFELVRDAVPSTWDIPEKTAERLRTILNAASDGDNLDRFFSDPVASIRRAFAEGWEIGATDVLDEFRGFSGTSTIGLRIWEAWHAAMVTQGRHVPTNRQDWDALPEKDRALDTGIGTIVVQRLAHVAEGNARANRAMREDQEAFFAGTLAPIGAFVAQPRPDDSTDRPKVVPIADIASGQGYASLQEAWDAKFPPHMSEKTDIMGKPLTETEPARLNPSDVAWRDETIAELRADNERLRARIKHKKIRTGERFRRLEQQIEIRDNQIAYHKERSVNVTARLEQAQGAIAKLQEETIAATADLVTAFNVERTRIETERDSQAREIAAHKQTIAAVKRDVALLLEDKDNRTKEIDTLRTELGNARATPQYMPDGAIGNFFRQVLGIAVSEPRSEGLTVQLSELQAEIMAVNALIRQIAQDNRAEITTRLVTICVRACRVHQLRGKVTNAGGGLPPAFVKAPASITEHPSGMPSHIAAFRAHTIVFSLCEHDTHWTIYRDVYEGGKTFSARAEPIRVTPETAEAIRRIMGKPALLNDLYRLDTGQAFMRNLTNYREEVGREIGELADPAKEEQGRDDIARMHGITDNADE